MKNQYLELFAYGCFAAASLLATGHVVWLHWRLDHPKKEKNALPRTGGGLLE